MPQEIRLWAVADNNTLEEIQKSNIGSEKRLHDWLENNIGLLDTNLLVIGREVETSYRGKIDLLCIDSDGDLVVVELKQGQTPREVTAQALDYASWVKDLTADEVEKIAAQYLNDSLHLNDSLQEVLQERFDSPPNTLNENHRSLIVAEAIDESSERIVRYLSERGVPINVATVQAFRDASGHETLAQVFLVEPEVARDRALASSGKRPYRTVHELDELAAANGLDALYQPLQGVKNVLKRLAYREGMSYYRHVTSDDGSQKQTTLMMVNVAKPDNGGLAFEIHATRFNDHLSVPQESLRAMLPDNVQQRADGLWKGSSQGDIWLTGVFRTREEVDTFVTKLTEAVERLEAKSKPAKEST